MITSWDQVLYLLTFVFSLFGSFVAVLWIFVRLINSFVTGTLDARHAELSASVDQRLASTDNKIERLSASVDQRLTEMSASLDRRMAEVSIANLERISQLRLETAEMDARLSNRLDNVELRVSALETPLTDTVKVVQEIRDLVGESSEARSR